MSIPDSVTRIESYTFSRNQLTSIVIPDSVISISTAAFSDNPLTSASVPSHLTLNNAAFPLTRKQENTVNNGNNDYRGNTELTRGNTVKQGLQANKGNKRIQEQTC